MIMRALCWGILLAMCTIGVIGAASAQTEWSTYRHDGLRTGTQPPVPVGSGLSDVTLIDGLHCVWSFPPDGKCGSAPAAPRAGAFNSSPIVVKDTVLIGDDNGIFYALDAETGALKWHYPKAGSLAGSCAQGTNGTWGRYGIRSSATYANIGGQDVVIFGAPDPDPNTDGGAGSARLFAVPLSADPNNPQPIWKSDVVAHVNCTPGNTPPHGRIAYSSPLVLGNKVYVGIHDAGDDPIQNGEVVAVDINTGHIDNTFHYASTNTRGGGVWNSPATDGTGVYFTTGNTRCWNGGCQPEPNPNHGLSMLRVDKDTGNVVWAFQPVPYNLDDDPDWAAGATVMSTSCGTLVASVQKDGWSYAVNAGGGTPGAPSMRWQFPPTGVPTPPAVDSHGDTDYKRPGAAWNDVFIVTTGGEARAHDNFGVGYGRLHALNACATAEQDRVRWIADLGQPYSSGGGYSLGSPTVTGGIIYIGTDQGHLLVLSDPSIAGSGGGYRCSNTDIAPPLTPQDCMNAGFTLVPNVNPLADFVMPDGGDIAGLRKEAALSVDRVFVGTLNGHVYMVATAQLSITLGGAELKTSQALYGVVSLSRPAPAGGATVTLTASDPSAVILPASVTLSAGLTTLTPAFTLTDIYSGPSKSVAITASYNGASATAILSLLEPPGPDPCRHCGSPARCCTCAGGVWNGKQCE
jgi:outer membrane protein assembly factor BamB